jgi:hypothetical protein
MSRILGLDILDIGVAPDLQGQMYGRFSRATIAIMSMSCEAELHNQANGPGRSWGGLGAV